MPSGNTPHTSDAVPEPTPRAIGNLSAYRRFWIVGAIAWMLDQATKQAVVSRLAYPTYGPPDSIVVVPGFMNLVHVGNTGAAWSMFTDRSIFLAILAVATLAAIFIWRRALALRESTVQLSFGLLCGGILGNLTDRLRYGHVVDFLDLHFGSYIYPTFNVADSCICVGVGIYLVWSLRQPTKGESTK